MEHHRDVLRSAEERVATLTVEDASSFFGGARRQLEVRHGDGITDGVVEMPDDLPQAREKVLRPHEHLGVLGAKPLGDEAGEVELVRVLAAEVDREGLHLRAVLLGDLGGDDARIEAARKKNRGRLPAGQPFGDRLAMKIAHVVDPLGFGPLFGRRVLEEEVAFELRGVASRRGEPVAGGKLVEPFEHRVPAPGTKLKLRYWAIAAGRMRLGNPGAASTAFGSTAKSIRPSWRAK